MYSITITLNVAQWNLQQHKGECGSDIMNRTAILQHSKIWVDKSDIRLTMFTKYDPRIKGLKRK